MGNNNTSINITLDRAQPTIYYAGDIVSGQVQCTIPQRTSTNNDIHLSISGDIGYTTTHATRMQNGQTNRFTERHDICIYKQKIGLNQIMATQAGNTLTDMTTLEAGQYSYSFSFRLPDILPPTLHPKDYPFVRYQLQLFIEKKWYSTNSNFHYPLRIYPRVNLVQLNNSLCSVKFDTKNKDMVIKGIIERSGLLPSEQTMLSLEIYNPHQLVIKHIDICLIQRYEIEQCRRRLEIMRVAVPQLFDINDQHIETTCPLKIPTGIPPSYYFKEKGNRSNVHISLYYDVKLEVKVKGLFSDFELQVPITIGTDSVEHSTHMSMTTELTASHTLSLTELQIDNTSSPS